MPLGVAALRALVPAIDATVAVVRPGDDALASALNGAGARVTICDAWDAGTGVSLAWGIHAAPVAAGWIVALADMPWVRTATIARVAQDLRRGAAIVAPTYRGSRGHPVGFAAKFYRLLGSLTGDQGARSVLAMHACDTMLIETDDPGILRDVDTPLDLDRSNGKP